MALTAAQHQKISALQQIANLVSQAQSVAGNQAVLSNVAANGLSLVSQWERSDPEFTQLAIALRQARVATNPQAIANLSAQVSHMLASLRGYGIGVPKRDYQGDMTMWDPIRGIVSNPLMEPGEPLRTFSHMGWRGSKKRPFGHAFPKKNMIEGYGEESGKTNLFLVVSLVSLLYLVYSITRGK